MVRTTLLLAGALSSLLLIGNAAYSAELDGSALGWQFAVRHRDCETACGRPFDQ